MQTVFLSHSTADTAFARRLASDLRSSNWDARTFEDVVSPDIPLSSTDMDSRIAQAIHSASFYIPILTPAALSSNWFKREIEIAINGEEEGSVAGIVPVLREECMLPEILDLRTPCDFTASYDAGFESLLEKVSVPLIRPGTLQPNETLNLPSLGTLLRKMQSDGRNLYSLSPVKFEELVAEVFESTGYRVELSTRSIDGGIDLFVVGTKDWNREPFIFECKRYAQGHRIGIEQVRSLNRVGEIGSKRRSLISTTSFWSRADKASRKNVCHSGRSRWDLSDTDYSAVLQWLASYPELSSEISQPIDQAKARYLELVDKKFSMGLLTDEENELASLENLIDEAEAPLYSSTIKRLRQIRDKLSSDQSR